MIKIIKLKIFFLILMAIAFFGPSFSFAVTTGFSLSNAGGSSLKSGLLGWWTMDGVDLVSNVSDRSGNGNNGNLVNFPATSTAKITGRLGQALKFDGVDDRVNINDMTSIEGSSYATWSFWLKPDLVSAEKVLIAKWNSNSSEMSFLITTGNGSGSKLELYMGALSNAGISSSVVLSANKWSHVVIVYDGTQSNSNRVTMYVDGVSKSVSTVGTIPTTVPATASNMNIGGFSNGGVTIGYTRGNLDDVRIYTRALSASEVKQLYNLGASKLNSQLSNSGGSSLKSGLLGWWTMDGVDISNGTVVDKSGSGNNGNLVNIATSTFYTQGKLGQAGRFDGTNDIVTTPQLSTGTGPFTVSSWVKVEDLTGKSFNSGVGIIAHFNNDAAGDFSLSITSSYAVSFLNNRTGGNDPTGESETAINVVTKNKWAHVVATWDGSVNKIYVDGVSKSFSSSSWGDWGTESGMGRLANLGLYYYRGAIDDVRVYNRALSASEVKQLYNLGASKLNSQISSGGGDSLKSSLVAWWTFDGANVPWTSVSAATALDSSGNSNTATLTGLSRLTSPVDGKLGQALYFPRTTATNGINTSGTIGSVSSGYSFSFWFKEPNINLDTYYLFAWADIACRFGGRSTNTINCYADAGSTGSAFYSTTVNDNKWHHVVFTTTDGGAGSNSQTLYIDGISRSTATETTNGYASRMWIASDVNGLSGNLKGTLDDFRFYSRVLSASEVKQLYNLAN